MPIFAQDSRNGGDVCSVASMPILMVTTLLACSRAHLIGHQAGWQMMGFQDGFMPLRRHCVDAGAHAEAKIVSISRAMPAPPLKSDPPTTSACGSVI
ncbi:hypothetical protein [Mesorhizobium sp. CA7]|uniref:hypothetical protein n=1 Tax=Mesorhizobium sp. CA7 TaxID=588501 RepID=UPI001CC98924|nr:hypothetical protein [Mesorhizobium sp. CA7]MBZ9814739.1 hypothetical protein [Mesorhizobium sp. CA7]